TKVGLAGRDGPHPHGAVPARGGEQATVRTERQPVDRIFVSGQRTAMRAQGPRVPQADRAVLACAGQPAPDGAARHAVPGAVTPGEGPQGAAGWPLPQPDQAAVPASGQELVVRADRHARQFAGMGGKWLEVRLTGWRPQTNRPILTCRGQESAAWGE